MVLAVTQEHENNIRIQPASNPKKEQNDATKIFTYLWKRHQSLRGFFVVENNSGVWQTYYPKHSVQYGEVAVEITKTISRTTKNFPATQFPTFLRGAYITTFYPSCLLEYALIDVRPLGIPSEMIGPHLRLQLELQKRLHFMFVWDKNLRIKEHKLCRPSKNRSIVLENWLFSTGLTELARGRIQFLAVPVDVMNCAPGHILAAAVAGYVVAAVAPGARPLPAWSLPLRVFGAGVWGAWAGALAAYALAWRVVARASLGGSAAAALAALSSHGGPRQTRVRAAPQRLQLAAALLASAVVIVAIYQGRLYTLMAHPTFYPEIDTLEQLVDSGMPVLSWRVGVVHKLTHPDPALSISPTEFSVLKRLANQVRLEGNAMGVIQRLEGHDTFAVVDIATDLEQLLLTYPRLGERLHILKQSLQVFHSALFVRRNWPWIDAFQIEILRFKSAGLLNVWQEDFNRKNIYIQRMLSQKQRGLNFEVELVEEKEVEAFSLNVVLPHLQLLGAGLIFATLLFIIEIYFDKRRQKATQNSATQ